MSIALCAVLVAAHATSPAGTGGGLAFPIGEAEPGTVAVRVVDRNRLPLGGALLHGVFESTGAAQLLPDGHGGSAALVPLEPIASDEDGRARLSAPEGGWCGVSVERSGFAAGRFLPLFAGHAYELVLDFGASVTVVCRNENGDVVDAELEIEHRSFPRLPSRAAPVRRAATGPDGIAQIDFVPAGRTVIFARGGDGSRGRLELSIGSAWRANALFPDDVRVLTLHPTRERFLPVTDREGSAIAGLRALPGGDLPADWASVAVEQGGVRVAGILEAPPEFSDRLMRTLDVRVFAPGWRALSLSVLGDEPPSAWTEPVALVRGVAAPPVPVSGRLWTAVDPYGPAHWESAALELGATPELDVCDGFSLAGALVDSGRVAAWLYAESDAEGTELSWLEPGSIRARLSVDGEPYHLGLVRFELASPALGAPIPSGLSRKVFTFADPSGVCELHGLFPGRWKVGLSTSFLNTMGCEGEIDVEPGAERALVLDATRGVNVRGTVTDESGAALSGGLVTVYGTDRQTVGDGAFPVAEDGTFLVTGLVPGAGYLLVWEEAPPPRAILPDLGFSPGRTAELLLEDEIPGSVTIVAVAK